MTEFPDQAGGYRGTAGDRLEALLRSAVDDQVNEQRQLAELLAEVRSALTRPPATEPTPPQQDLLRRVGEMQAAVGRIGEEVAAMHVAAAQAAPGVVLEELHDGLAGVRTDLRTLPEQLGPAVGQVVGSGLADLGRLLEAIEQRTGQLGEQLAAARTELGRQHPALDAVGSRLDAVGGRLEALPELGRMLAGLSERVAELAALPGQLAALAEQVTAARAELDRQQPALDWLGSRMDGLGQRLDALPELGRLLNGVGSRLDGLGQRLDALPQLGQSLAGLADRTQALDAQVARLAELPAAVADLQARATGDAALSQSVRELLAAPGPAAELGPLLDQKLGGALAALSDGVGERLGDLERQVQAVAASQANMLASAAPRGPSPGEFADIVREGVRDATRDFVRDYLREAVRDIVTMSTRDTERRITDHMDEAVLALAQALLTRRPALGAALSAGPSAPAPGAPAGAAAAPQVAQPAGHPGHDPNADTLDPAERRWGWLPGT